MAKRKKRIMEKELSQIEAKFDKLESAISSLEEKTGITLDSIEGSINLLEEKTGIKTPETETAKTGIKVSKAIRKKRTERKGFDLF